jgi:hypothetical protein
LLNSLLLARQYLLLMYHISLLISSVHFLHLLTEAEYAVVHAVLVYKIVPTTGLATLAYSVMLESIHMLLRQGYLYFDVNV